MKAGRDLDAIIAEKIMGLAEAVSDWKEYHRLQSGMREDTISKESMKAFQLMMKHRAMFAWQPDWFPSYSTDIAAAWEVVDKLNERGIINLISYSKEFPYCRLTLTEDNRIDDEYDLFEAEGETMAHAICLVALKSTQGTKLSIAEQNFTKR